MEPLFDTDGAEPPRSPYETGRYLVMFEDDEASAQHALSEVGLNVASTADVGTAGYEPPDTADYDALHFDRLNVAIVPATAYEQVHRLAGRPDVHVEPERYVFLRQEDGADIAAEFVRASPFYQGGVGPYPFYQGGHSPYPFYQGGSVGPYPFYQGGGVGPYPFYQGGGVGPYPFYRGGGVGPYPFYQAGHSPYPFYQGGGGGYGSAASSPSALISYLEGFRDAAAGALAHVAGRYQMPAFDESTATWGLQAIRAAASRYSGLDIRLAVLDTGFDESHPDFNGRDITVRSFIAGETGEDFHGHGTHVIGTACGPLEPEYLPRYGIAHKSKIFAGKVLNRDGFGTDGEVLAGMNWAITSGCKVISMSLGTPTRRNEPFSRTFERVAQRALAQGTVIVAAAGNESRRDMNIINPVSHPANCPSILAVAAVDVGLRVAFFSNQGTRAGGGQIDISAPGVDIYSSYPMPTRYRLWSGTSMATPHVAGVVALFAELKPDANAADLKKLLQQTALRIPGAVIDVGPGLVQAP